MIEMDRQQIVSQIRQIYEQASLVVPNKIFFCADC